METSNKSFWELIKEYTVNIPIIQRDYAQGRIEEKEKRDKFLNSIYLHLTQANVLDLDFIYGRINEKIFFPIDGQQRLTTLFLLHWYISLKENVGELDRSHLLKFAYDTRISSREFCNALIKEEIVIPKLADDNNFIDEIQNNYWFRDSWNSDPTIKAMLVMIQAIHEKFVNVPVGDLWGRLTNERMITFQVLDLGAKGFELTDELYIKMNSRGKQLTVFENFKASFIQFIQENYKDKRLKHPVKGELSYAGYFSYKIEKEWTDLFWEFRGENEVIDSLFMNYFVFIAQMSFFKMNKDAKADDFKNNTKQYKEIFKKEDNLLFLFNSLDKLCELATVNGFIEKKGVDSFFDSLFVKGPIDDTHNGEVRLFWNGSDSINIFETCINRGLNEDARSKIIFYVVIYYLLENNIKIVNKGLKYYIRVVRNLLQATRQRQETKYNTNVRLNFFADYWILFRQLATENVYERLETLIDNNKTQISDASLNNEKQKAKIILKDDDVKASVFALEEFHYLGGLIHQLKPQENISKLNKYSSAIREIWNTKNDTLIIQSLISCGFGGFSTKECRMGEMWYFGKEKNWSIILTCDEVAISDSLIRLLDRYLEKVEHSPESRLNAIIQDWFKDNLNDRSWKYYFMKYSEFTSCLNYYAWYNDYELRMLGSESVNPLLAYHINPFVFTVCNIINNTEICDVNKCYQQYTGNSPLYLENGITLTLTQDAWVIDNKEISISNTIIEHFSFKEVEGRYLLMDNDSKDRIEIAIDFINDIYK